MRYKYFKYFASNASSAKKFIFFEKIFTKPLDKSNQKDYNRRILKIFVFGGHKNG
jgi:hypothetical protein